MIYDFGRINIGFYSLQEQWDDFKKYMERVYAENNSNDWEFLNCYDSENHTIICDDGVLPNANDIVYRFAISIVEKFEKISFSGKVSFGYYSDNLFFDIQFFHFAYSNRLWWEIQYSKLGETHNEKIVWNAITNEKENQTKELLFPNFQNYTGLLLSENISVKKINDKLKVGFVEHLKVGDSLFLKADYDCEHYPVEIEVFNNKNQSLGYLENHNPEVMFQLAYYIDVIDATVAKVIPLSSRSKNAKYALLDIKLNLKKVESLRNELHIKAKKLIEESNIAKEKKYIKEIAYESLMNEFYHKRIQLCDGELYALRKGQIPFLAVGKEFSIEDNSSGLCAMNGEKIIGRLRMEYDYVNYGNNEFFIYFDEIIKFHNEKLKCVITEIVSSTNKNSEPNVKMKILWK